MRDPRVLLLGLVLALLGADEAPRHAPAGPPAAPAAAPSDDSALEVLDLEARRQALEILERDLERKVEALRKLREEAEAQREVQEHERGRDLGKLVKFYQAMKPQNAARLLEELPLDLAAEVLSTMKAREAGKVLNAMKPGRAVQLSRRMAGVDR